jgi:hypothetical protein
MLGILAGLFLPRGLGPGIFASMHYRAADFPTDPHGHSNAAWGNRFFCLALLFFTGFSYLFWRVRKTKKTRCNLNDHTAPVVLCSEKTYRAMGR